LAVNVLQFNGHHVCLGKGMAAEKIDRGIMLLCKKPPFILLRHGRKLVQIPDHEELHAAEGLIIAAVPPQHRIHGIQQIGTHHADLINHQQIEALDNPFLFLAEPEHALPVFSWASLPGRKGTERELKKGMEGDPARIDGRNPGGRGDDHPFGRIPFQVVQKGGFAGPRFSR
jgi:hypothetical protein